MLFFLLAGMATYSIYSCESKKSASMDQQAVDSLLIRYQVLSDSVDHSWAVMIADDDDKHLLMKRLLLEVSYTNNYDKQRFEELNGSLDRLQSMRYDQKTMRDSDMIDAYDSATFELADQIFLFARSHPRFEDFPLMAELIEDINAKNNFILIYRIHYDNWVKELNSFIESNREILLNEDPSLEAETMPLFALPS